MIQKVVLADDSATARMIIRRCLEISGLSDVTFYEAQDGMQALDLLNNHEVDLVVTDLNMPNMSGQRLLKELKSCPRFAGVPVLVVTSASNKALETDLMQRGALAVVNKPVTPSGLVRALAGIAEGDEDLGWG